MTSPRSAPGPRIGLATTRNLGSPAAAALAVLIAVMWTIPVAGLVLSSLRSGEAMETGGWFMALGDPSLTLENYREALGGSTAMPGGVTPYLVNSMAIALPATALPLLFSCLAAYALAWMPMRRSLAMLMAIIGLQLMPVQVALLPMLQALSQGWTIGSIVVFPQLDMDRSYIPLWLAHTVFGLPLGIFLLYGAMSALPRDVMEAARLDGAGHGLILSRIVVPLALPVMAAFAVFQFLWAWNDVLIALAFTGGTTQVAPITAYLVRIQGLLGSDPGLVGAVAVLAVVIPTILFIVLHRAYARGILGSVIKGS